MSRARSRRAQRGGLVALALGAAAVIPARAQEPAPPRLRDQILDGLRGSFALPWHELMEKKSASEWRNALDGFSGSVAFSYPLKTASPPASGGQSGSGAQGDREAHVALMTATLTYRPMGSWFAGVTAYSYLHRDLQAPWNPDFTYVFGYDDWHPYTLSLVYSNYGGNRWRPDDAKKERRTRFREGSWSLGWKFQLAPRVERFLLNPEGSLGCAASLNLSPDYTDLASGRLRHDKTSLSLGCKYAPSGGWYVNVKANYYPRPAQQQPWDPDFTYGFGYFDWHPGTISVQYNNYSGNRLPGRARGPATGRFQDGSLTLSYSWSR
jgi:hypothetical protein